jgi:hypothetical protein
MSARGNAGTRVFGTEYTDFFLFFLNCSSDSMQLNLPTISIHPPPRQSATGQGSLQSPFTHSPCLLFSHRQHDTARRPHRVTSTTNIQRHPSIHPSIHPTIDTTANSTSQRHTVKKSRDKKEKKTAGIPTFADSKRKLIRLMAPPCPLRLAYVQMPGGAF